MGKVGEQREEQTGWKTEEQREEQTGWETEQKEEQTGWKTEEKREEQRVEDRRAKGGADQLFHNLENLEEKTVVEQLVATVHICLQQAAERSAALDKAQTQTLNTVLFALESTKVQLSL